MPRVTRLEAAELFSIGLYVLHDDGTPVLNEAGEAVATYDNNNIMNFGAMMGARQTMIPPRAFGAPHVLPVRRRDGTSISWCPARSLLRALAARVWTGFTRQPARANLMRGKADYINYIDPNQLSAEYRDRFPKVNLYDQYLGDGYPLCSDFPRRSFLRAGARYRREYFQPFTETEPDWFAVDNAPSIVLDPNSSLARALCGRPGGLPVHSANVDSGACTFADEVVLADDLACSGDECRIFAEAYMVQLTVGTRQGNVSVTYEFVRPACVELTFHEPMRRVTDPAGRRTCVEDTPETSAALSGSWIYYSAMCTVKLLVSATDGWVGLTGWPSWIPGRSARGLVNYFPVRWLNARWPTPANGCAAADAATPCTVQEDGCYCGEVALELSTVFTDASNLPSAAEVESALPIGAPHPSDFGSGVYALCTTPACRAAWPAVRVYTHATASGQLDARAIFEIAVNGTAAYRANKEARVHAGGFSLRNPPHFMSFRTPLHRDAAYETEALLHHLMYHVNTAPFIAYRLIQRLVTSNPSPRYVKVVADAFRTGSYDGVSHPGGYSSLAACVHAILLDREARSVTLDLDPSHGQLREPLLRVLHVLRALEYDSYDGRDPELFGMSSKVGQQVFRACRRGSNRYSSCTAPGLATDAHLTHCRLAGAARVCPCSNDHPRSQRALGCSTSSSLSTRPLEGSSMPILSRLSLR